MNKYILAIALISAPIIINQTQAITPAHTEANIIELTKSNEPDLNRIIAQYDYVVFDFYADRCGPCRHVKNTINNASIKYKDILFIKINFDDFPHVRARYNVKTMPTLIYFKNGIEQLYRTQDSNVIKYKLNQKIDSVFGL